MKVRAFFISLLIVPTVAVSAYYATAKQKFIPESAIREALAKQDSSEVIRSLIEKMKGELEKDYDTYPNLIREVEQYTQSLKDSATIAFLHSLTAEMYHNYYKDNRWQIQQRTELQGYVPKDIREWTSNLFQQKITKELNASLAPVNTLQNTPTTRFKDILELGNDARTLRPTLYDFLLQRAIGMQPSADFYQRWIAFRTTQFNNPKAELLVSLDYLNYRMNRQSETYPQVLDSLTARFTDKECQLEIDLARLNWLQANHYCPEEAKRDSTEQVIYDFCLQNAKKYAGLSRSQEFKNTLAGMEQAMIRAEHNNNVYPGKNLELKVTYKNTPELTVRIYQNLVSPEVAMRNQKGFRGKLVKEINYTLPVCKSFLESDTLLSIPMKQLGLYEYEITSSDKQLNIHAPFSVSRLAAITRTNSNGIPEVLVTDYESGKPLANVPVICYNLTMQWKSKRIGEVKTDVNGFASLDIKDKKLIDAVRPVLKSDTASLITNLSRYYDTTDPADSDLSVYLFTDRGIYRPGQIVSFKGIVYTDNKEELRVKAGMKYSVTLRDANYQEVATKEFTTNEFGSFHGEFTLPKASLNGNYTLTSQHTSTNFQVEEYKRPSFEVEIQPLKEEVSFGEMITLHGKATNFSGVALQKGKVTWTITRHPFWLRTYMPNQYDYTSKQIAEGTVEVDNSGQFQIPFTAKRPETTSDNPICETYILNVIVTDSKGETQETEYKFSVGDAGIVLFITVPYSMEKEKASAKINAQTLNGEKIKTQGTYTIFRMQEEKTDSILAIGTFSTDKPIDKSIFTHLPSGKYRLQAHTMDKNGVKVEAKEDFILYSLNDARPPITTANWLPQSSLEADPNETVYVTFGTSESPAYVLYELFSEQGILLKRELITMRNENRRFPILFEPEYNQGITASFTFVKEGKLNTSNCQILKREPERALTFKTETFRNHLLPGSQENWKFRLLDKDSLAVRAEVLASMYDASLDQIVPFKWYFQPSLRYDLQTSYFLEGLAFQSGYKGDSQKNTNFMLAEPYKFDALYSDWNTMLRRNLLFYATSRSTIVGATPKMKANGSVPELKENAVVADIIAEEEIQQSTDRTQTTTSIRKNFAETAFFYPILQTDEQGEVSFNFTVPESNTTWKLQLLAQTENLNYGYLSKEVITNKPIMVQPNLPRFLREGDEVVIASQVINQLSEQINGSVSLEIFNPENNAVLVRMEKSFLLAADSIGIVQWNFQVADWANLGTVGCRIVADSRQGSDGEQHLLPVLSKQILVTESMPFYLDDESETRIKPLKHTIENPYRVTLEINSNPIWSAVQSLSTLNEPKQEDILSWFAVYYSNALSQYIANAHPKVKQIVAQWNAAGADATTLLSNLEKNEELKQILLEETPWVLDAKNETEQKQRLQLLFDMNRAEQIRSEALKQLQKYQNWEGGWSWLQGMPTNYSMTLQILKGMAQLVQLNAIEYSEAEKKMQMNALKYLDKEIQEDYEALLKSGKEKDKICPTDEQIEYLFVRSFYRDVPELGDAREAIRFYTQQAEKKWDEYGLYSRAAIAWLMQQNGQKETAARILDWFRKTATTDKEKGMYWANNRTSYASIHQPVETHCLIMALFNWIQSDTQQTDQMKQWLLTQKRTQSWESVPATQNAVYALLLTGNQWIGQSNVCHVALGNKSWSTTDGEAGTGYLKLDLTAEQLSNSKISIRKEGKAPAWGAVYFQYFAPVTKVEKQKGILNIEKKLFVETNDAGTTQMRPVTAEQPLRVGDKVIVRLTIRTDRNMDYVYLKDLRAACFEPVKALSGSQYQDGIWYYRSAKDASENIYIEHLPQGTFVLEYPVYVSRSGAYAEGISTIQCLYAPEFISHTEGAVLKVD